MGITRKQFINRSAILGASVMVSPMLYGAYGLISDEGSRAVRQIINPRGLKVGTLPIVRAFPGGNKDYVSPFVLLDEFGPVTLEPEMEPLGVAAHPHAGVVPTSYFVSGGGHHKDSMDYDLEVRQGQFMMFSSGKGAIHMEETGGPITNDGGIYHGFQIWLNLPKAQKYIDPETYIHGDEHMPVVNLRGATLKVIMGAYGADKSSALTHSPAFYYHVKTEANARLTLEVAAPHNAFIYNVEGELELKDQKKLKKNHLAIFERGKNQVEVFTEEPAEFLMLGGQPLDEPVVSYGPFVMNSMEEIEKCYADYRAGKMGDPKLVR
jgi:redox-sensitive bicupin YhaK (pirin superfamily)